MRQAVIIDAVRTRAGRGEPGGALSGARPADPLTTMPTAIVTRNGTANTPAAGRLA